MSRIKKILPLEKYQLEVTLDDESMLLLDFSHKLSTIRYGMLADELFFKKAMTDGCYIRWDNLIEISLTEAIQMSGK